MLKEVLTVLTAELLRGLRESAEALITAAAFSVLEEVCGHEASSAASRG